MRQFLALELSTEMLRELSEMQCRLAQSLGGWRWIPPESLHLTVRFLGEVHQDLDGRAREGWRQAASHSPAFRFRLAGLGHFPSARRPRVLWIGLPPTRPPGALAQLAAEVEREAVAAGFEPETRPFHAHLTLARAARRRTAEPCDDRSFGPTAEMAAESLTLFRSHLLPSGARYERLERFPLARGETPEVEPGRERASR